MKIIEILNYMSVIEMFVVTGATIVVVIILLMFVAAPYALNIHKNLITEQKLLIEKLRNLKLTPCTINCPNAKKTSKQKYLHQYNLVEEDVVQYYEKEFGKIISDFAPEIWILTDYLRVSEFQNNEIIKSNVKNGIKYRIFYIYNEMNKDNEDKFKGIYSLWQVPKDVVKLIHLDKADPTTEKAHLMKYAMATVSKCKLILIKGINEGAEHSGLYGFISLSSGGRDGQSEYFKMLPCTLQKYFNYLNSIK